MFYRFTIPRDYPESTWIELWKLETSIHVSFMEHFQTWKSLNKGSLKQALRDCVNDWNAYYGVHGGTTHISSYSLDEYLKAELDDIHRFMHAQSQYNSIPLHVDVFRKSIAQNADFALYIEDSSKRSEEFFHQVEE